MGLIDGPQAPVRVIVGAGAGTERPHCGRKNACVVRVSTDGRGCPTASPRTGSPMPSDRHRFLRHLQQYGPLRPRPGEGRGSCTGLPSRPPVCSRVQSGAVCQWWLSWVKHVRPGMLHVSLFCSLLRSLRSFFLRFCSRNSHTLSFSCRPFLRAQRTTHA